MRLLALHTLGHDTSACIFRDGELEFACESERVSRVAHDQDVRPALNALWQLSGLAPADIDHLACTWPLRPDLIAFEGPVAMAEGVRRGRLHLEGHARMFGRRLPCTLVLHEAAHAALAAHHAGWRDDLIVFVNEGFGACSRNSAFRHAAGAMQLLEVDALPWFATGFGWTTISALLGIGDLPSSPGKTMAVGGYGRWSDDAAALICRAEPTYTPTATGWRVGATDEIAAFIEAQLGFDGRADFVHTFQALFTEAVTRYGFELLQRQGSAALALCGGCALNLPANSALRARLASPLPIPPNCGDSGQAIGAALHALRFVHGVLPQPFSVHSGGPAIAAGEAVPVLCEAGWQVRPFDAEAVAQRLAGGQVVALAQGRSELGPRALGHRSLLASATANGMRRRVSEQLKGREWYRPLGCVAADEDFARAFPGERESPFMLFSYAMPPGTADEARHADGSSRIQTVASSADMRLWSVLRAHADMTGDPFLLNTSLNAQGRPIAATATDVLDDFLGRAVDCYVFDDVMAWRG